MWACCDCCSYADGKCIAVIKAGLHFSHPGSAARHRKGIPVDQLQRTYWYVDANHLLLHAPPAPPAHTALVRYAGTANNKRSLFTLAGTHGWSTGHEMGESGRMCADDGSSWIVLQAVCPGARNQRLSTRRRQSRGTTSSSIRYSNGGALSCVDLSAQTRVVGRVTPESILAACKKLNMLAPCGHPA